MHKTSILITATIAAIVAGGFAVAQQSDTGANRPVATQTSTQADKPSDAPGEYMKCGQHHGGHSAKNQPAPHRAGGTG